VSSENSLLFEVRGAVAWVTLNRPDKRNAIGPDTCRLLQGALQRAGAERAVRVVVLTGAGEAFCAGGDLSALAAAPSAAPGTGECHPKSLSDVFLTMHELGKPIVAMVNGHALAGGLGLVLAADLALASDRASFGTTEIRVGLWPMMVSAELARNVGRKKALELMLSGERISAAEAERIGIVNRVVPHLELSARTEQLAAELASRSPAVLALGLRAFYASQEMAHPAALRYLEEELERVLALEDAREGLAAFMAKREPRFQGR
jgi:enoyl-CoA hydratase/carnithine racemase